MLTRAMGRYADGVGRDPALGVSCAAADPLGEPRRRVREMGQQPSSAEGGGFASRQTAECVRVRQETSKNLLGRLIFIVPTVSGQRDASS